MGKDLFDECIADIKDHIFDDRDVDETHLKHCVLNVINEYKMVHSQLLYLAGCHAATAEYDGTLKSTSATRRNRYANICDKAVKMIDGNYTPFSLVTFGTEAGTVRIRCERAAKRIRDMEGKSK